MGLKNLPSPPYRANIKEKGVVYNGSGVAKPIIQVLDSPLIYAKDLLAIYCENVQIPHSLRCYKTHVPISPKVVHISKV